MSIFKKQFFSLLTIALVILLSSESLHAGKNNLPSSSTAGTETDDAENKNSAPPSSKAKNKESFTPRREIFSQQDTIDYQGLEQHIHYKFNKRDLLRDALHSMLPNHLGSNKQQFERLEFFGDSILGLIIKEKLMDLYPDLASGSLSKMSSRLTENRTLTDLCLWNLDLEQFLPFPGKTYRICNVAESLIGAIYKDDSQRGMNNATRFVFLLLDQNVFKDKADEILGSKNIDSTPKILPEQENTVRKVCTPERMNSSSPKTLLNEILLKAFDDRPEYITSLQAEAKRILFSVNVIGAQIGRNIRGVGNTRLEAEENAAKIALNSLSSTPLYTISELQEPAYNFRTLFDEIVKFLGIKPRSSSVQVSENKFEHDIILNGLVIGHGEGSPKAKAQEAAAEMACYFLAKNEEEKQRIRQEIRRSEWKQKRESPTRIDKPFSPALLPTDVVQKVEAPLNPEKKQPNEMKKPTPKYNPPAKLD